MNTKCIFFRFIICAFVVCAGVLIPTSANAQEICNNGIDDDGDGLIDLHDVVDCSCTGSTTQSTTSLIPNFSFEQSNCCPTSYSQVSCATGWSQATEATSDYFNCGYSFGAATAAGLTAPDGNGMIGCIFSPGWQEYVGSCLLQPMLAGTTYNISLNIASTPIDGFGDVCNAGVVNFGPIDITLFGYGTCQTWPIATSGCDPSSIVLGSATYTPVSNWSVINIIFTPTQNINAIMLGSPCVLPPSYSNPGGCYPYFYFDNLVLNENTSTHSIQANQIGNYCRNNIVLQAHPDTVGTYQWYKDSVAIVGATDTIYNVPPGAAGIGNYQIMLSTGTFCSLSNVVPVNSINISFTTTTVSSCANTANGQINITGTTNTTLPLNYQINGGGFTTNASYTGLTPGTYNITVRDSNFCTATLPITVAAFALPVAAITTNSPCVGATLNLTGLPPAMVSYSWTDPNLIVDPIQNHTKTNVALSDGGIYIFSVTDGNGCTDTAMINVTIKPLPTPTANSNTPLCVGQALNLNSGGGGTYVWWGPNNFANATQSPSVNNVTAVNGGIYHVSVTGVNGCIDSITTTVVINPLPIPTAASNTPVCFGQTLNLTGGPALMSNYNWWGPNSFTSGTQSPTKNNVVITDGGTYHLTVTDANGCVDSTTAIVVINPLPIPTAASNTPVCVGLTLNLNASGGNSYTWWGPNNFSSVNQNDSVANVTMAYSGTYHASVTDVNGCVDSITTAVVINSLPIATASSNRPCVGFALNFNGGPIGMNTYNWTGPTNFPATQNPTIASPTLADGGTYTLTVIDANSCTDTAMLVVVVNPSPIANAGADGSMCAGGNVILVGSGAGAGGSYVWTPTGTGSTSASYTVAPTQNTFYQLSVTDANGCSDIDLAKVAVNPLPVVNFSAAPVCKGDSNLFINTSVDTSGGGALSCFWSYGDGQTSNNCIANHKYVNCGTFSATLIETTDSGCVAVLTKPILVNCVPTAALTATSVCYPAATVYTNSSAISDTTVLYYNWDFNYLTLTHTNDLITTTANPTSNNFNDGSYVTHLITYTSAGCADSATVNVVVYPKPNADFFTDSVCLNNNTSFTDISIINVPDNITTWCWDFDNNGTCDASTQNGVINPYPNLPPITATLIITSNHGCKDTVSHTIIIYSLPIAAFTVAPVCLGAPSQFINNSTVSAGSNITNNDWIFDTAPGSTTSTAVSPANTYITSGSFPVELTVTTNFGCVDSVVINAIVNPNPVVNFIADTTNGCEPLCINLSDLSTISAVPPGSINSTYLWDFGDGNSGSTASQTHCYQNDATYSVTLTVTSNKNCTSTLVKPNYITAYPNPTAAFNALPSVTTILDPNIALIDLSQGGYTINWVFGDGNSSLAYGNDNFVHTYADSGTYVITQIVTTDYGCIDSTHQTVIIGPEFGFYIPNAFTPNGDNRDDLFNGKGFGIIKYELLIFNRWGELIDKIDSLSGGWDGRKFGNGDISQTDVYVWEVRLTDVFNKAHKYVGNVTLLR